MSEAVTKQILDIMDEICTNYCKYPDEYLCQYKDPDDANDKMLNERCDSCPMGKLNDAIHENN